MKKDSKNKKKFSVEKTLGLQSLSISVVMLFAVWYYVANRVDSSLILPTPKAVLQRAMMLFGEPEFWNIIQGSMRHILLGFGAAFLVGVVAGCLSGFVKGLPFFFYPWVNLIRAVPVMSIILYLILFLSSEQVAMSVSFLIVFPTIYTNVLEGFRSIDKNLLEMAKLYRVPFRKQLMHIYLPTVFPYLMAASVTGMGINIKAVITAEALAIPKYAIGSELLQARNYLDTEALLAWTLLLILLAVCLDVMLILIRFLLTKGRRNYVVFRRKRRV